MALIANEYPDVWEFSNECPSPKNYPTWVEANVRARKFVETFLLPQFFGRVIIWGNSRFNRKVYDFEKGKEYRIIDWQPEAEKLKYFIGNSCEGGGHFTALFVPLKPDLFLEEVLSEGHYGKPQRVTIGTKDRDDPLDWKHGQDIAFLESDIFRKGHRIFTFSHDAQFLYDIFR